LFVKEKRLRALGGQDRAAQERQFGRVAIEGRDLFEYVEFRFAGDEEPLVRKHEALGRVYEAVSGRDLSAEE
jgi:hypothetical protein